MGKIIEKIKNEIHRNTSDATALVTVYTPLNVVIETFAAGMTDEVSLKTRLGMVGLCYAGLASVMKLRDASKNYFGITKKSSELIKYVHDMAWGLVIVLGVRSLVYLASGEDDWKKIGISIGISVPVGGLLSGPGMHLVDIYRDFTGWKESERVPKLLQNRSRGVRGGIMGGLAAASIGLTGLVYGWTPDKWGNNYDAPSVQQINYEVPRSESGLEQTTLTLGEPTFEGTQPRPL